MQEDKFDHYGFRDEMVLPKPTVVELVHYGLRDAGRHHLTHHLTTLGRGGASSSRRVRRSRTSQASGRRMASARAYLRYETKTT